MLLSIVFPIVAGILLLVWAPTSGRLRRIFVMVVSTATSMVSVIALILNQTEVPLVLLVFDARLSVALRVDGLSCIFVGMISFLWPLACLYALEYMSREGGENRFFAFYLMAFGVCFGIAFSANILTLYFFYELLTLITLPLVMHSFDGKARYAGKVYLGYSMSGAALGFIAMVFLLQHGEAMFRLGGSVAAGGMDNDLILLAYALGFFGFGVKAAILPFHKWLLRASVAPTPVTALLHAVAVVKAGVFAVVRLTWYGFGPALLRDTWVQTLMISAAMITIVYGSARAFQSNHLKRRLAWSTISNLSYVLLGVSTLTMTGLVAGLTHMVFHGVLKITLFFCVGAIHYKTHREFVPDLEGCAPLMPIVFAVFTTASLGLIGIPPLAGFSSKWMLATACVELDRGLGYLCAGALVIAAVLSALYLLHIVMLAYFPRQNRSISKKVPKKARRDPGLSMTIPLTVLSVTSIFLGLWAKGVTEWIARMVAPVG